jgi:muramoyltetrapeptide carboxypeptidase
MLDNGIAHLESLGYRVRIGQHVYAREPQYFAGTVQQRAADLHAMFADSSVRAILCARGGYGSQALLPSLDLDLIRANPKPLIGCSDLTALQLWLYDQCGLVSLHGPMAAGDLARDGGVDLESWNACLGGTDSWQLGSASDIQTLRQGQATGALYGGCLSLMVATLATPYEVLTTPSEDILLFVEDIAEKPYKIERMFSQWRDAGKLQRVKGIIFGELLDCEQPNASYKLVDVLSRMLADFPGPVACGLRSGHVSRGNVTLPIGVQAELNCDATATLTIKQAATVGA